MGEILGILTYRLGDWKRGFFVPKKPFMLKIVCFLIYRWTDSSMVWWIAQPIWASNADEVWSGGSTSDETWQICAGKLCLSRGPHYSAETHHTWSCKFFFVLNISVAYLHFLTFFFWFIIPLGVMNKKNVRLLLLCEHVSCRILTYVIYNYNVFCSIVAGTQVEESYDVSS